MLANKSKLKKPKIATKPASEAKPANGTNPGLRTNPVLGTANLGTGSSTETKKSTRGIHSRIAEELGIAIISGQHPPGSSLPNEIEASERLGISRPAYREAMRILMAKGLVESRPKTGTKVTARSTWNLLDPDVLGWMFMCKPSESFIQHLYELRSIVEPAAAALAAQRRTAAQLARMGHALEEMSRRGLYTPEGRLADEAFHAEVLSATGNEALMVLNNSISAAIRWTVIHKVRANQLVRDSIPDHEALYAAIADGDAERARAAALALLELALEDTKLSLKN